MNPRCKKCGAWYYGCDHAHRDYEQVRPVIPSAYATPIETASPQHTEPVDPSWSVAQHVLKEAA